MKKEDRVRVKEAGTSFDGKVGRVVEVLSGVVPRVSIIFDGYGGQLFTFAEKHLTKIDCTPKQ